MKKSLFILTGMTSPLRPKAKLGAGEREESCIIIIDAMKDGENMYIYDAGGGAAVLLQMNRCYSSMWSLLLRQKRRKEGRSCFHWRIVKLSNYVNNFWRAGDFSWGDWWDLLITPPESGILSCKITAHGIPSASRVGLMDSGVNLYQFEERRLLLLCGQSQHLHLKRNVDIHSPALDQEERINSCKLHVLPAFPSAYI